MQNPTDMNRGVLAEMKNKNLRSPSPEKIVSLDSSRKPTMIFTSKRGQVSKKRSSDGIWGSRKELDYMNWLPSTETHSGKTNLNGDDDFKVLNGNLSSNRRRSGVESAQSSDVLRSQSSSPFRSPAISSTLSRQASGSRTGRTSLLSSRTASLSSSTSSLHRKKSVEGEGVNTAAPPLIPPPKSFLERQASLSSSMSSLSSRRLSQTSLPQTPPPPLSLPISSDNGHQPTSPQSELPPPPFPETETKAKDDDSISTQSQRSAPSRSSSTKSQKKTSAPPSPMLHFPPPPPYPPPEQSDQSSPRSLSESPPPEPPPPPPPELSSPDHSQVQTSHTEINPVSSGNPLTPKQAEISERLYSMTSSEVMGMFDNALGFQSTSLSSLNETKEEPGPEPFSPALHFPSTEVSHHEDHVFTAPEAQNEIDATEKNVTEHTYNNMNDSPGIVVTSDMETSKTVEEPLHSEDTKEETVAEHTYNNMNDSPGIVVTSDMETSKIAEEPLQPEDTKEENVPEHTYNNISDSLGIAVASFMETRKTVEEPLQAKEENEELNSPRSNQFKSASSEDSDDNLRIELHEQIAPPKRRGRRPRRMSSDLKVTKLRPDIKTVRQQIKPGMVDELASLFTNRQEIHSPERERESYSFDMHEKIEQLETLGKQEDLAINVRSSSQNRSGGESSATMSPRSPDNRSESSRKRRSSSSSNTDNENSQTLVRSKSDESLNQHTKIHVSKSEDTLLTTQPRMFSTNSDSSLDKMSSLPESNSTPAFDFLSASREIFKQVINSRSSSRQNSLRRASRDEATTTSFTRPDTISTTPDLTTTSTMTYSKQTREENVPFASALSVSSNDSEHTENKETPTYANMAEEHYLNIEDNTEESKQSLYTENSGEPNSDALHTSTAVDHEVSGSIFDTVVNIPSEERLEPRASQLFLTPSQDKNETEKENSTEQKRVDSDMQNVPECTFDYYSLGEGTQAQQNVGTPADWVNNGLEANFHKNNDVIYDSPPVEYVNSNLANVPVSQTSLGNYGASQASVLSLYGSDTETSTKIKEDKNLRDSASECSTGSPRLGEKLMTWTKVDTTTSKDDDILIDDKEVSETSPRSRGSSVSSSVKMDDTTENRNESDARDFSASGTNHELKSTVVFESETSSSDEDEGGTTKKGSGETREDTSENQGSSPTYENVTTQRQDGLQRETQEAIEAALFAHRGSDLHEDGATDGTGRTTEVWGVEDERKDSDYTELVGGRSNSREDAPFTKLTVREDERLIYGQFDEDSSFETTDAPPPEDFLSILDDIELDTDITSGFVGKSRSRAVSAYSKDKSDEKETKGDSQEDYMSSKEDHSREVTRQDSLQGDNVVEEAVYNNPHHSVSELSTGESEREDFHLGLNLKKSSIEKTHYAATSSGGLDDEIKELHEVLSPQVVETSSENPLIFRPEDTSSTHGSISSKRSSGRNSRTKETVFNSAFFEQVTDGDNKREVDSPQRQGSISSEREVRDFNLPNYTSRSISSSTHPEESVTEFLSKADLSSEDEKSSSSSDEESIKNREERVEEEPEFRADFTKNEFVIRDIQQDAHHENEKFEEQKVLNRSQSVERKSSWPAPPPALEAPQEEELISKDKFKALRNVFEKGEQESKPETHDNFETKRNSFKVTRSLFSSSNTEIEPRNEEKQEIGKGFGSGFTRQVSVDRYSTRGDLGSEYLPPNANAEIDTSLNKDGERTDTSSASSSGTDDEKRTKRLWKKKSKQHRSSYDLQTGVYKRDLISQGSFKSSSSRGSAGQGVVNNFSTSSDDDQSIRKENNSRRTSSVKSNASSKISRRDISRQSSVVNSEHSASKLQEGISRKSSSVKSGSSSPKQQRDISSKSSVKSDSTPFDLKNDFSRQPSQENNDNRSVRSNSTVSRTSYDLQFRGKEETKEENTPRKSSVKSVSSRVSTPQRISSQEVNVRSVPLLDKDESSSSESERSTIKSNNISRQTSSVKSKTERKRSDSSASEKSDKMTAVVGEVSTFGIHKQMTTHEESFSVTSDNSSRAASPKTTLTTQQDQSGADIFLIQDNKGEFYALQEVDESQNGQQRVENVTAHVIKSSGSDNNYSNFNGVTSPNTSQPNFNYTSGVVSRGDIFVDSTQVEDDKAREVISAFLDSQETSRQNRQSQSVYSTGSVNQNRTINQNLSQGYDTRRVEGGYQGFIPAGDSTGRLITLNRSDLDGSSSFQSNQQQGSVVIQQPWHGAVNNDVSFNSGGYQNSNSYVYGSDVMRNSTISVQNEVNSRADNSQTWNVPGFEPYTTGGGANDSFSSSMLVTNFNTPQQQVYTSHPNTPYVVDTLYDSQASNNYVVQSPTSQLQPLSVNVNQYPGQPFIAPYQTTPISITTTTQAVVGEKVDMQIAFSPPIPTDNIQQQNVSMTTDLASMSSEEESSAKRYVVKSVPQKSSLKKTSKYDSSAHDDTASDIVYTKKETVTADVKIGGQNREIVLEPYDINTKYSRHAVNASDSFSPSSVDEPIYRVYGGGRTHQSRSLSPATKVSSPRQEERDYYTYERTSNVTRDSDDRNLYRVRSSSSEPDRVYTNQHTRGRARSRSRSPEAVHSDTSYRIVRSGKKAHSPERFFKNPTLSLRKDDFEGNDYSSEEETGQKRYRTVTKVYLNGEKPRSRSQSPNQRYRVSSAHTQDSLDRKRNQSFQNDERSYQVLTTKSLTTTSRGGSQDLSDDDSHSGFIGEQKRYRIAGTSDSAINRHGVRAHSSPKLTRKQKSYEDAEITRTEKVLPSRSLSPTVKTHKTVIQLEVDSDKKFKERSKSHDELDSLYKVKHVKSADDVRNDKSYQFSTKSHNVSDNRLWRTGKAKSTERLRRSRSGSDNGDSDFDRTGVHDSSRVVKTTKQKKGNKMFVVNSTLSDPQDSPHNVSHPPGWYKSTIDINENHPEKLYQSDKYIVFNKPNDNYSQSDKLVSERSDAQSYKTEKTVYFVRESSPPQNLGKLSHRAQSTEFVSPDSGQGTEIASSDGENDIRQKFERVERIYEVRTQPELPEHFKSVEDLHNDLRVLRGKILIKNRLDESDHVEDDFDENTNIFDSSFHMGKDNPLYSSDPDIMASLQREEEEELSKHVTQDITFETVNRIAHKHKGQSGQVQLSPKPRRKQNLSALLLSKLANVDSKDIRQTIDVEHHNEEIYGDIDFIHADGERRTSTNTSNFDSVNEKVELTLTQGKAYVIIKVIAERIVPTDYEFNVWRKSQAIVTRQIEIDLLANDQRRRLYQHVMDSQATAGSLEDGTARFRPYDSRYHDVDNLSAQERQLSSMETLKLFSQILDVAEGQGDKDHTDIHTRQEMGQLGASGSDLLY